jgi:hypothetical protein
MVADDGMGAGLAGWLCSLERLLAHQLAKLAEVLDGSEGVDKVFPGRLVRRAADEDGDELGGAEFAAAALEGALHTGFDHAAVLLVHLCVLQREALAIRN